MTTGVAGGWALFRDALRPSLEQGGVVGTLGAAEIDCLLALVEVLIPSRYQVEQEVGRSIIISSVESVPGLASAYESSARMLDQHARLRGAKSFASLSLETRNEIMEDMLWRYESPSSVSGVWRQVSKIVRRLERAAHGASVRGFRELVVRDLLKRFYKYGTIKAKIIGYQNLPGVAGNPRDYVSRPRPFLPAASGAAQPVGS